MMIVLTGDFFKPFLQTALQFYAQLRSAFLGLLQTIPADVHLVFIIIDGQSKTANKLIVGIVLQPFDDMAQIVITFLVNIGVDQ